VKTGLIKKKKEREKEENGRLKSRPCPNERGRKATAQPAVQTRKARGPHAMHEPFK